MLFSIANCRASECSSAPEEERSDIRLALTEAKHQPPKAYPAPDPGAGAGFTGAPPTETGPSGLLGSRDVFLRDVLTNRARTFGLGMEEVVSGVTAFCRESTRPINEES
jgi:hypothetical protein